MSVSVLFIFLIATAVSLTIMVFACAGYVVKRSSASRRRRGEGGGGGTPQSEYIIEDDISNGRESLKLPAISYKRQERPPDDYHYVNEHIQYQPVGVDYSLARMQHCECLGDCSDDTCGCSSLKVGGRQGHYYDSKGRLSSEYRIDAPEVIYECNAACKCNHRQCQNMVIQAGCRVRLALFKTRSRGWGVRTLEDLRRGTFIGVYSGELITASSSCNRHDDTYLFNLCNTNISRKQRSKPLEQQHQQQQQPQGDPDIEAHEQAGVETASDRQAESSGQVDDLVDHELQQLQQQQQQQQQSNDETGQFVCDAKFYGNFTRFINHSCEPNVIGIRSFTKHQDDRFPYISFFTNQDLPAYTELTLNYGDNYWLVKCKRDKVFCLCKKPSCKFNKKNFSKTLKMYEQHYQHQQQQASHQTQQEETQQQQQQNNNNNSDQQQNIDTSETDIEINQDAS